MADDLCPGCGTQRILCGPPVNSLYCPNVACSYERDEALRLVRSAYQPRPEQAEIESLRAENERLREALVAEREENLWNAYNTGSVRDGKWDHLCMSDGEWLARECGFNVSDCRFDDEAIRAAIPKAARKALKDVNA
jgi:hypothetical protein